MVNTWRPKSEAKGGGGHNNGKKMI